MDDRIQKFPTCETQSIRVGIAALNYMIKLINDERIKMVTDGKYVDDEDNTTNHLKNVIELLEGIEKHDNIFIYSERK